MKTERTPTTKIRGSATRAKSVIQLGAAFMVLAAGVANADVITTFNSRAAWNLAVSGAQNIDFGTLAPPSGSYITYATPPGLTVDGVNFSNTGTSNIYVVNQNYCCSTYNRGFDQLVSNVDGTGIIATLPGGTTGAGFDLFTVQIGDGNGTIPGVVSVVVAGNTYLVNTPTAPNSVFFGFLDSTGPISSFTFTPQEASTQADVMNFSFGGTHSGTVPEPTTMLLFGAGLAGLGAVRRRKMRA